MLFWGLCYIQGCKLIRYEKGDKDPSPPTPRNIGFKMRNNRMLAVRTTKAAVNNNRNAKESHLIEIYLSIYFNCVAVSL